MSQKFENRTLKGGPSEPVTLVNVHTVPGATEDCSAPSQNTAAVVTYAATPDFKHVITGLAWSYSADPTNGNLKVEINGGTVFTIDITSKGPGVIIFPEPKTSAGGNVNMVITLAAGSGTVVGKVSVLNHYLEPV